MTSVGLAKLKHHNRVDLKEVTNEDVNSVRPTELGQADGALHRQHQQPQGPVVQCQSFLSLRSLKVLLVENDDSTHHVVSALLRKCSYEVTAVANGLEAWKLLSDLNTQIDLVLTEVAMPYLSGIGLLSKIMNDVTRKNTPVIMTSSDDSMGVVFSCLSRGAVDSLVKPIRKNELKNLWQHLWRKCNSQSSGSGNGNETGIRDHKSTKSRRIEECDDESDNSDQDDEVCIELNAMGGSNNGSGIQSSWPKRVVEVDASQTNSLWDKVPNPHDITSAQVTRPETSKQELIEMGKDLNIGVPKSSSFESHMKKALKPIPLLKSIDIKDKSAYHSKESPALELSLKRTRDVDDANLTQERNILRHSSLSDFSSVSNVKQAPTGNVDSCSPRDISSEAAKLTHIQSNSNHRSSDDMGSTINNDLTAKPNDKQLPSTSTIVVLHSHHTPLVPCDGDVGDTTVGKPPKAVQQQVQVRHHHHHYHHHHHHVHKLQQQKIAGGNAAGYGSASGCNDKSNDGIDGRKIENENENAAAKKFNGGDRSASGVGEERSAWREVALNKFRQKRKQRCFKKKVRYQNKKKLAEQRPRVRGQFFTHVNNEDADS